MKYPATAPLFLLDEKGEPYPVYDVYEWAKRFPEQRIIERTEIEGTGFVVETIFMGVRSLYDFIGKMSGFNIPAYFETIVYSTNGVAVDGDKYNDLGDDNQVGSARRGHKIKLGIWRQYLGVDPS